MGKTTISTGPFSIAMVEHPSKVKACADEFIKSWTVDHLNPELTLKIP